MSSFLPKHRSPLKRLLLSSAFYDRGSTLITVAVGGGATWGLWTAGMTTWAIVVAIFASCGTLMGVAGAVVAITEEARKESVHELAGCLETLLAIINPPTAPDYDRGIRATLHRSIDGEEAFEQVLDYVGDDRAGRTAGRRLPGNAGLIGKVIASREAIAVSRTVANHEMYIRDLQADWGYTEEEARRRDMSAMAWIAVPLEHSGRIGGVLFLDSTKPGYFYEPTRQREIVSSAVGIAKFAVRRYTQK
jgi:hypothetical protein